MMKNPKLKQINKIAAELVYSVRHKQAVSCLYVGQHCTPLSNKEDGEVWILSKPFPYLGPGSSIDLKELHPPSTEGVSPSNPVSCILYPEQNYYLMQLPRLCCQTYCPRNSFWDSPCSRNMWSIYQLLMTILYGDMESLNETDQVQEIALQIYFPVIFS